jgi:hypothetical protein
MFDVYKDQGLQSDGVEVAYQNCGGNGSEAATQYATYLNSGDDVDLFVAEAGWILNYINDDSFSAPCPTWASQRLTTAMLTSTL